MMTPQINKQASKQINKSTGQPASDHLWSIDHDNVDNNETC